MPLLLGGEEVDVLREVPARAGISSFGGGLLARVEVEHDGFDAARWVCQCRPSTLSLDSGVASLVIGSRDGHEHRVADRFLPGEEAVVASRQTRRRGGLRPPAGHREVHRWSFLQECGTDVPDFARLFRL